MDDSAPVAAEPASPSPGPAVPLPDPPLRLRARVLRVLALVWLILTSFSMLGSLSMENQNGTPISGLICAGGFWLVLVGLLMEVVRLRRVGAGCFSIICLISLVWTPILVALDLQVLSPAQRMSFVWIWLIVWAPIPIMTLVCWRDLRPSSRLFGTRRKLGAPPQ